MVRLKSQVLPYLLWAVVTRLVQVSKPLVVLKPMWVCLMYVPFKSQWQRLMWSFMSQFNSQTMPLCFCFICGLLRGKSKTCITSYTALRDLFLQCLLFRVSPHTLQHSKARLSLSFGQNVGFLLELQSPSGSLAVPYYLAFPQGKKVRRKIFLSEFFLFTLTVYLCNISYPWVKTYYKGRK